MIFGPITVQLKDGRFAIIRNAESEDAEELIDYLKVTTAETPFLLRNPEEINFTPDQEIEFINSRKDSENSLLLIAKIDGKLAGNASYMPLGTFQRGSHRCSAGIALYQSYCGLGLGKIMLNIILQEAAKAGYEQAELEVVTSNDNAVALYKALGFDIYGERKHSMKYKDGSYADEYLMMKMLEKR